MKISGTHPFANSVLASQRCNVTIWGELERAKGICLTFWSGVGTQPDGLPQSPRLLRNDKRGEFICRSAATKQSSWLDRHVLVRRPREDNQVCDRFRLVPRD
jgi:hypothetical protein